MLMHKSQNIYLWGDNHLQPKFNPPHNLVQSLQVLLQLYKYVNILIFQNTNNQYVQKLSSIIDDIPINSQSPNLFTRHLQTITQTKFIKETVSKIKAISINMQAKKYVIKERREEVMMIKEINMVLEILKLRIFKNQTYHFNDQQKNEILSIFGSIEEDSKKIKLKCPQRQEKQENACNINFEVIISQETKNMGNEHYRPKHVKKASCASSSCWKNSTTRPPSTNLSLDRSTLKQKNYNQNVQLKINISNLYQPLQKCQNHKLQKYWQQKEDENNVNIWNEKENKKLVRAQTAKQNLRRNLKSSRHKISRKKTLMPKTIIEVTENTILQIRKNEKNEQSRIGIQISENNSEKSITDNVFERSGSHNQKKQQYTQNINLSASKPNKITRAENKKKTFIEKKELINTTSIADKKRNHRNGTIGRWSKQVDSGNTKKKLASKKKSHPTHVFENIDQLKKLRNFSHQNFENVIKQEYNKVLPKKVINKKNLLDHNRRRSSKADMSVVKNEQENIEIIPKEIKKKNHRKSTFQSINAMTNRISETMKETKEVEKNKIIIKRVGGRKNGLKQKKYSESENNISEESSSQISDRQQFTYGNQNCITYNDLFNLRKCFIEARQEKASCIGVGQEQNSIFFIQQNFISARENMQFQQFLKEKNDKILYENTDPFNIDQSIEERGNEKICELERIYNFKAEDQWIKKSFFPKVSVIGGQFCQN